MKTAKLLLIHFIILLFSATDGFRALAQTFYSLQNTNFPPLPFVPFDVPVYDLGSGFFAFDDTSVDYVQMSLDSEPPPLPDEGEGGTNGTSGGLVAYEAWSPNDLWIELTTFTNETVTLKIHAPDTAPYDLFRTFLLRTDGNSDWQWMARGTNNQSFILTNGACRQAFYVLGNTNDTDADALTAAYERLVTKTSPTNSHSVNALFTDAEMENILVNDRRQDCGNEQNSQFESTLAVLGTNVIVAWVDSNQGVYGLGNPSANAIYLTNRTPRFVGYAISLDNGVTFEDMGNPLLSRSGTPTNDDGDAGDPVLAIDQTSEIAYLAGTSPRNSGWAGIPLWKSTNGGVTFADPIIVRDDIVTSDKPWITVDDWVGTGQHDVYLGCVGNIGTTNALWLTTSTNYGTNWSAPLAIRTNGVDNVVGIQSIIPLVSSNHTLYTFWFERTEVGGNGTNWLKMRQVLNRGTTLGDIKAVCPLVVTNANGGKLGLRRSNTAPLDDVFTVVPFPVPAFNPITANNLYVAYADHGTNESDKADIFITISTNGGTNWTNPQRVNTDETTNDQWMPVLAVKPDGTQLFMAWYDRRGDTNNSLIDLYGRFTTIETNGNLTFGTEFKITTISFPPAFAGTNTNNIVDGHYDPVYPPEAVNLNWWYPEWPLLGPFGGPVHTVPTYTGHVGEYNSAWANQQYAYLTWTDYRLTAISTVFPRNQSDIRFLKLTWPE